MTREEQIAQLQREADHHEGLALAEESINAHWRGTALDWGNGHANWHRQQAINCLDEAMQLACEGGAQ